MQISNLTPTEELQLNGQLSPETAERLVALDEFPIETIKAHVQEGIPWFPEDFLWRELDQLETLAKELSPVEQKKINAICAKIKSRVADMFLAMDYSESEACKAIALLDTWAESR